MKDSEKFRFGWILTSLLIVVSLLLPWTVLAEEGEGETLKLDIVRVGPASTTVASGASFSATFRVENNSTGIDKDRTFSGTASVATTGGIACTPTSASFSALAEGSPLTISLSCTAPTGPATGTIIVSASGTPSPKTGGGVCGVGGNKCSDDGVPNKLTVNVNAPPDATPPVIVPTVSGTLGNNGWYISVVTVSWSVSDPESGIASTSGCGTTNITSDTTGMTLICSATNGVGLSNSVSVAIKRDATPPSITAALDRSPAATGWYNIATGAPKVQFTCSDATSGLAGACPADYTFAEGKNQSYSQTIYDNAGNSASAGVSNIDVDLTAPSISIIAPADGGAYILNAAVASSYSCSDQISGVASCDGPVASGANFSTSPVGPHSFTVNAADVAGNAVGATNNYSVIYNWTGFFRPVDNLPTMNVAKAGSAIPVKFSLSGNQGLSIFAAGYPKSQAFACDTGAPADTIDETVTAGNSSLSYDPLADQYVYVWKTDKAWSGCRQLVVKLNDGMEYRANFKFTK